MLYLLLQLFWFNESLSESYYAVDYYILQALGDYTSASQDAEKHFVTFIIA